MLDPPKLSLNKPIYKKEPECDIIGNCPGSFVQRIVCFDMPCLAKDIRIFISTFMLCYTYILHNLLFLYLSLPLSHNHS